MAVTAANVAAQVHVRAPKIRIVNVLPALGDAENGEMYLLIQDSHTDDKKLHIKLTTGWLKVALS